MLIVFIICSYYSNKWRHVLSSPDDRSTCRSSHSSLCSSQVFLVTHCSQSVLFLFLVPLQGTLVVFAVAVWPISVKMKRVPIRENTFILILVLCSLLSLSIACERDLECSFISNDKCCHGTCIDEDASCISGGAIAGIVIGCLIVGGVILSFCLCFCCACGPFQNRNQGTVIRYGQGVQTTTTGVNSHSTANVQATYGASYPQPGPVQYPVHGQTQYQSSVPAHFPSSAPGVAPHTGAALYPPHVPPPSYDEASKPPPYNPVYPQ